MKISDEAVEAAAEALFVRSLDISGEGSFRKDAIAALEAAAPHMIAGRDNQPLETVEALDALPDGSVIISRDGLSVAIKEPRGWWVTGDGGLRHPWHLLNEDAFLSSTRIR